MSRNHNMKRSSEELSRQPSNRHDEDMKEKSVLRYAKITSVYLDIDANRYPQKTIEKISPPRTFSFPKISSPKSVVLRK